MKLYIIPVKMDDIHSKVFFEARYSKDGILNSIDKNIPKYEEHLIWYSKQNLKNMYLIYCNKYVGYVRISDEKYISIAMCEGEYNKGYATLALTEIVKKYSNLKAEIMSNNVNSLKLFLKFPCIELKIIDA